MQAIMTTTKKPEGIAVQRAVKAGAEVINHSDALVVRTNLKAGGRFINHSEGLVVQVLTERELAAVAAAKTRIETELDADLRRLLGRRWNGCLAVFAVI